MHTLYILQNPKDNNRSTTAESQPDFPFESQGVPEEVP